MNTHATKSILLFGDSYTFGKIPGGLRYDINTRYTGVLQNELGNTYEIIEEGLRGRLLLGENPFFPHRDGSKQFGSIVGSHVPFDLLVIFLGTNDTNSGSNLSPKEISENLTFYIETLHWWCAHLGFPVPKIMIVAPPNINEPAAVAAFKEIYKGSAKKIKQLPILYKEFADTHNIEFLDTSTLLTVSDIDGIHLDPANNKKLGVALAEKIRGSYL